MAFILSQVHTFPNDSVLEYGPSVSQLSRKKVICVPTLHTQNKLNTNLLEEDLNDH